MLQYELLGIKNTSYSNLILSFLIGTEFIAPHISTFHLTTHKRKQLKHRGAALLLLAHPQSRFLLSLGSHPRIGQGRPQPRKGEATGLILTFV